MSPFNAELCVSCKQALKQALDGAVYLCAVKLHAEPWILQIIPTSESLAEATAVVLRLTPVLSVLSVEGVDGSVSLLFDGKTNENRKL